MFSPKEQESLGRYNYRLIDPRNGETFYVGQGKGNRVSNTSKKRKKLLRKGYQQNSERQMRL